MRGVWSELRAERVRREVVAVCAEPIPAFDVLDRVARLVDEAVPSDASCWSTFDPATSMVTAAIGKNIDERGAAAARFFELEYALDSPGQYRELATSQRTVAVLHAEGPASDLGTAAVRDHLAVMGVGAELRLLLRDQHAPWGGAGLMRATTSPAFSPEERAFLELLGPTIAAAVRAGLIRGTRELVEVDSGPAVLVLGRDGVVEATPAAVAWLDQLQASDRDHGAVPSAVQAVAAAAMAGQTVTQRARSGGSWVALRGAPLGPGRAVVTIAPAGPPEVTSLVEVALGLTGREREVVAGVLRGQSTKEIAAALHLSPYTVQDHLKAVFAKAGVNSRRELIADVFFGVYAPRLGSAVGADGFFAGP
jgi:DNA-binding CsgD family transcriptional regulator